MSEREGLTSCREANDQPFLDLALSGKADLLISGDRDRLALVVRTRFLIETPEAYRARILQGDAALKINSAASCN